MKFGHVFKEKLKSAGFPPDWVESAISYSQLKKCINRVTNELAALGLDPETLKKLLKQVEDYNASSSDDDNDRPLEYLLSGEEVASGRAQGVAKKPFHPKLIFYVSEETGELENAHLDDETRQKLHMLAVNQGMTNVRVAEEPQESPETKETITDDQGVRRRPGYRTVEVHLTSDSEFFTRLAAELSGLEALQAKEEKRMHVEIQDLGHQIARMVDPDKRGTKKLIATWREIFQIYIESDIFFGSTEADHAPHDADKASQMFIEFADKIARQGLVEQLLKKPEATKALNTFMHINREILQGLQYGEMNRTAMRKILKSTYSGFGQPKIYCKLPVLT